VLAAGTGAIGPVHPANEIATAEERATQQSETTGFTIAFRESFSK
jgi:hypothetical protein